MDIEIKDDKTLGKIYEDAFQPAVKQIGGALEDTLKTARLLLAPLSLCGVGADRFQRWCDRIRTNVKDENMQSPNPNILIPTINSLSINLDDTLLGEMFFNILQSSVDKTKQEFLSPAFPKILEQISQEEAKILTLLKMHEYINFSCYTQDEKEKPQVYKEKIDKISNENINKQFFLMHKNHLMLLNLVTYHFERQSETYFEIDGKLVNHKSLEAQEIFKQNKSSNYQIIVHNFYSLELNDFGKAFADICISEKCKEFIN